MLNIVNDKFELSYKGAIDQNYNDINYSDIGTQINLNPIKIDFNYLEENKHVGSEHYANAGVSLNFNDQNKLSFSTKKNFKTDSTELYNLNYALNKNYLVLYIHFLPIDQS